jgi:hypothetical protein
MMKTLILVSSISFLLILSFSVYSAEEGLVGYWALDEGNGDNAKDSSGSDNNGTIKGKSQWVQGKIGMALSFVKPNAIYVEIPDSKTLNITEQITMSAWIKPTAIYKGADWMERNCVVAKRRAYYMDITETGNLASYLYGVQPQEWLVGNTDMNKFLNKWVHVATVYDGKEHKLYIDGSLDASVKKSGPITTVTESLYIGWVDNNRYFDGIIDDVKVYSRGLAEGELAKSLSITPSHKLATCWGNLKSSLQEIVVR